MRVLGIDPGTSRIGYGLIGDSGGSQWLIAYGVLEIRSGTDVERIERLGERYARLLRKLRPQLVGIESLFFSKNRKTALAVSQARGALILATRQARIPVYELGPGAVKLSVAGDGRADKRAVARMVARLLRTGALEGHDDASDALAVALATAQVRAARRRLASASD
ncbi:MAG: crossover junction endodeoxyribonuclease RuvC [Candidatus Colwellbacteria bacterium]|nr:crossover junction endodeoxyribonuclease RuvC [Candidatus Colwellbacteria bacterium]